MSKDRTPRTQVKRQGKPVPGLFQRTTKTGQTRYELYRWADGKPTRKTLAAQTVTDAIREARRLTVQLDDGLQLARRADVTLGELRDLWVEWTATPACDLAPRTVKLYTDRLDRHILPALDRRTKATAVTAREIRRMIAQLNRTLSGSSVRGCVSVTSRLFTYAVREGTVGSNPVRQLERGDRPSGKRTREPRYLDSQQIGLLLGKLDNDMRPVVACLAYAGLRISEALALRWQDIDLDTGWLRVPGTKTKASAQPVPVVPALADELRAHRARTSSIAYVFAGRFGEPWDRKTVLVKIYKAGDAAGLNPTGLGKVGCHTLRHSCAGLLLDAGVPVVRVAAILRHSDTRTLLTNYAGLVESQREHLRNDLETAFAR
jgi:integrase